MASHKNTVTNNNLIMKNKFIKITAILGVVLIILIVGVTLSIDRIVKSTVESVGSDMLQTSLTVDNISISIFNGSGSVEGLRISNPEGFGEGEALVIESIYLELDIGSLLSDTTIVKQVTVSKMNATYKLQGTKSNFGKLMENMNQYSPAAEDETESNLIIDYFLMQESSLIVKANIEGLETITVNIPKMERRGIGREGDASVTATMKKTLGLILGSVAKEVTEALKDEGVDQLLDKAGDAIKNLFGN